MRWISDAREYIAGRRLRAAEDAYEDACYTLDMWGDHPGTAPSQKRRMEERVERTRRNLRRRQA